MSVRTFAGSSYLLRRSSVPTIDGASSPAEAAFQSERGVIRVGVDVFRALLEVGESSEGVARLLLARVVHLEEHALVALDDDRVGGIVGHAMTRFTGSGVLRKSIRQPAKWR
jgi:hypothetical protein